MSALLELEEDQAVILDASGDGTADIGPTRARQTWHVTSLAVHTSTATAVPQARVYGPSGTFLAGTYTGSQDTTDLAVTLTRGARLRVVWTGGDPGATAIVSVYGRIEVT